ncbi:SNF2 family N-terminal domain containing protein [Rhypophila decipiens]
MNTAFSSILDQTVPVEHAGSPADAENSNYAASLLISHESTTLSMKSAEEDEGSELLTGITGTCNGPENSKETLFGALDVKLESPEKFVEKGGDTAAMSGVISPDSLYLTTALLDEESLRLQVRCNIVPEDRAKVLGNGKRLRVSRQALTRCTLDIILYGPRRLFSVIGEFIDECNEHLLDDQKLYLQDPVGCDDNVRYCNPHRLPPLDSTETQFTFTLAENRQCFMDLEDFEPRPELLELLESQEDLPEAPQPPSIRTLLERHQKQALTFMLRREQGWDYSGTRPDIWEVIEDGKNHCFVNRVSDARQAEEPPPFSGGIIADPMGFGKTLSMIALIASDDTHLAPEDAVEQPAFAHEDFSRPTLVIVPPALLGTWEQELTTHVTPLMLPWRLHHGKTRLTEASELDQTALVLTTYHTVSLEGRSSGSREASLLFSTRWRRVVLDEAHFIRNSERQMARAVCSLKAVSRWAVTGTPIQNHISDLSALLKFLAVYPYSEKRVFEADISQPWKSGNGDEAVKRLKRLAGCLVLRRPRKVVQLPPRHDHAINIDFTPEERLLYNQVRMQVVTRLAQMESAQKGDNHVDPKAAPISFVNVLQQIEAMRMVCNLGLLYPRRHDSIDEAQNEIVQGTTDLNQTAQRAFSLRLEMGVIQCHSCSFALDGMTLPRDDEPTQPIFTRCLKAFCSSCVQSVESTTGVNKLSCDHTPTCPMALVRFNLQTLEEPLPVPVSTSTYMPTKIKALIQDIERLDKSVKCVVFSNWRMTLNVVKAGFDKANISSLRFDGQVPHRERQGVLDKFRNDPSIRVLLLTLSCGAVGLTLTNATRAYLMEPHWNPTIEDQALARIHRIGQKQEVTTIRFYVRDSFEENVVKNQEFKRALASILLGSSGSAVPGDKEYLDHLKSLI